jgi:7-cyano-7-deazaguanine synthase
MRPDPETRSPAPDAAVLVSGGLDSAILAGLWARDRVVQPIYVRCGLWWEDKESAHCRGFLAALGTQRMLPLLELAQPVADIYGNHWSLTGLGVPSGDSPDDAVFLPGRNVLLLAKALLLCHIRGIRTLGLAPLGTNPFPDATPEFFKAMAGIVNTAVGGSVIVELPFLSMKKQQVMELGRDMPLAKTFSCIRPEKGMHCGACNKCAERIAAFHSAGMPDPTPYATPTRSHSCTP